MESQHSKEHLALRTFPNGIKYSQVRLALRKKFASTEGNHQFSGTVW